MTERYSRRILRHVADQRYSPRTIRELARELGIDDSEYDAFRTSVEALLSGQQVVLSSSDQLVLPPPGSFVTGQFRRNARGFGFLIPDSPMQHGDLFVPAENTAGAMTGDRVRARVVKRQGGRRTPEHSPFIGVVEEIIQRAERRYVGNLMQRGNQWLVQVDGKVMNDPVIVRDPGAKNASVGDKVVVELVSYPEEGELAEGVITEVLGEKGVPEVETLAVMRAYSLVEKFDDAVVAEARKAASTYEDDSIPADRTDFTSDFIVTIDPPDAKDFDDAISCRRIEGSDGDADAAYELGVYIADVSHFVQPGTVLDQEAYSRGNSTYLPRKVIPMLPELLSNGVCSLQEGVNRYVKAALIRFDRDGNVLGAKFASGVIRSAKRMTYLEAQALIDGDLREARRHAKTEPSYGGPLIPTLKLLDELAKRIEQRRIKQGMITLGLPEVELVYSDAGHVIDAQPEDNAYTHRLIEMFMVEANEAAARLFNNMNVPMIRRVHPDPPTHDLSELRQFARVAGHNIPRNPSRQELQQLLEAVRGTPAQHAVHLAVLQTLSKAEYSPAIIGHFALASEHYTHFTSPIRRYPDLIVHRALQAYLDTQTEGGSKKQRRQRLVDDPRVPDENRLHEMGRHCSQTERNSEAAERDLRSFLVLQLLAEHLGDDFDGTVTGVTSNGLFIQIDKYLADGFIRVNDLASAVGAPGDRWRYNRATGALVAQRSGKTISIGDRFTVRIARVVPEARLLDLVIISDARGKGRASTKQRKQPPGAKKAHEQTKAIKKKRTRRRK